MFRNYFKIIQSFIHANSFAEDDSNYVQKSNTNFCLILENIKFSHYLELLSPQILWAIQEKLSPFQNPQLFAFLCIAYIYMFPLSVYFPFAVPYHHLPAASLFSAIKDKLLVWVFSAVLFLVTV